ncbi:hypothetical protein ACFPM3_06625 [Streptomyces coeruleoprunus]|uniref:Transposase n=1 Tax=Streptomyces coeruleoprunus TaxID=285563 RepID=A0ABV9XAC7_9ACTN
MGNAPNLYGPVIDAILKADLTVPRKHRHTVKRIYDRLLDAHEAVDVSYQMVRAHVAARREEIRLEAGKGVVDAPHATRPPRRRTRAGCGTSSRWRSSSSPPFGQDLAG